MVKSRLFTIHLPSPKWRSLMFPMTAATTTLITTLELASRRVSPGKLAAKPNGTILAKTISNLALPISSSGKDGLKRKNFLWHCQEYGVVLPTVCIRWREVTDKANWMPEALQVQKVSADRGSTGLRFKVPCSMPISPANAGYCATYHRVCSSTYCQWHTGFFEIQQQ